MARPSLRGMLMDRIDLSLRFSFLFLAPASCRRIGGDYLDCDELRLHAVAGKPLVPLQDTDIHFQCFTGALPYQMLAAQDVFNATEMERR